MGKERERTALGGERRQRKRSKWKLSFPRQRQEPSSLNIPPPRFQDTLSRLPDGGNHMWGWSENRTQGGSAAFCCWLTGLRLCTRWAVGGRRLVADGSHGLVGGYVERRELKNPRSYLCILDILCSSISSLPRKPLAKGLFSIFNWVIWRKEREWLLRDNLGTWAEMVLHKCSLWQQQQNIDIAN